MALTMGDANGVGPEILLRLASAGRLGDDILVYGDAAILTAGLTLLDLSLEIHTVDSPGPAREGVLNIVDVARLSSADLTPGTLSRAAGEAAREYVRRATLDALAGQVAGVVTLPMNKEATRLTDPEFIGHTEYIAGLCRTTNFAMMLTTNDIAVSHLSTHLSLRQAIDLVTADRISTIVELTHNALSAFIDSPRIAVCGLNPHAGEHGLFGDEDEQIVRPAIEDLRFRGFNVSGPHPADTVFYQAIHNNQHDAIVCMYHDQGHAPMKLVSFESGVNVTIGLPIVRTSVDHGTAFDIAWQGKAFTSSLEHALAYAWKLSGRPSSVKDNLQDGTSHD